MIIFHSMALFKLPRLTHPLLPLSEMAGHPHEGVMAKHRFPTIPE